MYIYERVEGPTDQLLRDVLTVLNRNLRMQDGEKVRLEEHTQAMSADNCTHLSEYKINPINMFR